MSQTVQLVDTLKRILRERKITYYDIGEKLGLSEANIKRMFSKRHFTLARLEEILGMAGADLGYLLARMNEGAMILDELSEEAERELATDIKLLLFCQLLMNRWEYEDIVGAYNVDDNEATRILAKLDRMGIIELLPGNRVKTKLSRDFKWIHNGPVYQFFEQYISREFFDCKFNPKAGELLVFVAGNITRQSNMQMQNSMRRLAREFDELAKEDGKLPLPETFGTGMVLAMRPWELSIFAELRHAPNPKRF
ncbi:MAG: helix-turn-helix transcriptional regulator [Saccharospirillum sp.]|nr:helix-turn-helix transcriptional regulator [Saccharospirillum sp.]